MKNQNIVPARTLMNNTVTNMNNENIGEIEEIMIDCITGKISYAVLSFGGFLGFGDKYFAIPWERLTLDKDQRIFKLDVSKESLQNSPGFDKNNWPDFADAKFLDSVEQYYNSLRAEIDPVNTRYGEGNLTNETGARQSESRNTSIRH